MKKLLSVLVFTALLFMPSLAKASEDFTLWPTGSTFAGPYTGNVVAISNEISNNSGLENLEIVVLFEDATPDQCDSVPADYQLFIQVEGSINGIWFPIATSHSKYNNCDDAIERIVKLGPDISADLTGFDIVIAEGSTAVAKVSHNVGVLTEKFRVKLILQQGVNAPLTNVVVSGFGRKY